MVAESVGRFVMTIDTRALSRSVLDTAFSMEKVRAGHGWWALKKRVKVEYGAQLWLLDRAIGRAEWLAMG